LVCDLQMTTIGHAYQYELAINIFIFGTLFDKSISLVFAQFNRN